MFLRKHFQTDVDVVSIIYVTEKGSNKKAEVAVSALSLRRAARQREEIKRVFYYCQTSVLFLYKGVTLVDNGAY